jgi:drug/metabolite transporter (DMT)-like permease
MSPEILAIACGVSSAVSWGAADFSGGFATKRSNVFMVIFFSQVVGIILLFGLLIFRPEAHPDLNQIIWGGLAGLMGAFGLVALYKGLADGCMGIVAPLSAVMTTLVPVVCAAYLEGLPRTTQIMGFGSALVAVWFLATTQSVAKIDFDKLGLPFIAGLGFGLFFVCIDRASSNAIIWPLITARMASLSIFAVVLVTRKQYTVPQKKQWLPIALSGILDTVGNAFFVIAAQLGRLDVSAVLTSMYPAATVFLAWGILKERLQMRQWIGVGIAVLSMALIAG